MTDTCSSITGCSSTSAAAWRRIKGGSHLSRGKAWCSSVSVGDAPCLWRRPAFGHSHFSGCRPPTRAASRTDQPADCCDNLVRQHRGPCTRHRHCGSSCSAWQNRPVRCRALHMPKQHGHSSSAKGCGRSSLLVVHNASNAAHQEPYTGSIAQAWPDTPTTVCSICYS